MTDSSKRRSTSRAKSNGKVDEGTAPLSVVSVEQNPGGDISLAMISVTTAAVLLFSLLAVCLLFIACEEARTKAENKSH